LKVVPTHSYALLDVEDGHILGNPVLTVNGDIRESETNGLQLNGNNAYLSAEFKSVDCILQPSNCPDGFTIALKVKFDALPKNEARYIVDTGAHIGSSPGISMYVKGDQLHYQLTAKEKTWSVRNFCFVLFSLCLQYNASYNKKGILVFLVNFYCFVSLPCSFIIIKQHTILRILFYFIHTTDVIQRFEGCHLLRHCHLA